LNRLPSVDAGGQSHRKISRNRGIDPKSIMAMLGKTVAKAAE